MIESNNPEINVDELMERIREEVARRRARNDIPAPPASRLADSTPTTIELSRLHTHLSAVEYHASRVGAALPELARFSRVKRKIGRQVARIVLYLSRFITEQQKQFNWATLHVLQDLSESMRRVANGFGERVKREDDEVTKTLYVLREMIEKIVQEQRTALPRLEEELGRREERLQTVEQEVSGVRDGLQGLVQKHQTALQRLEEELGRREERLQTVEQEVSGVRDGLQGLVQKHQTALQRLEEEVGRRTEREKELEKALYQLKVNLVQQELRLSLLLEEARKRLPAPLDPQQLQTFVNEDQHRLDALYISFEDQFRGTREDIKERLKVYLPLLKEKTIGTEQMPVLDVGCGRGEWLELLQEEGLLGQGVDINRVLVEQCRQRGFEVTESDALSYLRKLPERSIGAITGFHIIEHLPFDDLIKLLDETTRVLKAGGVAIFETPNPQNVMVGSCNFYLDPTHRHPLPSPTLKFLAEARGLCRVQILDLHPYPTAFKVDGSELAERFNDFFYGPQDYAMIGYRV